MPHAYLFWSTENCSGLGISLVLHDPTNKSRTFCALDTDWKLFGWPYLLSLDGPEPN